jgi:hypothetical protein
MVIACGVHSSTHRVVSTLILVAAGTALIALAATATLTGHDVLAGAFGVLSLLGFSLAALAPRIQGEVKAGLNGFRFELVREIVDTSERIGSSPDVVLAAIHKAINDQDPMAASKPDADDDEPDDVFRDQTTKRATIDRSADALLVRARQALTRR